MSEVPVPYRANDPKTHPLVRIAAFLNTFLGPETFKDLNYPKNLQKDLGDMSDTETMEFLEFTYQAIFKETAYQVVGLLGRELKQVEINLIQRRIKDFLRQLGFKPEKD